MVCMFNLNTGELKSNCEPIISLNAGCYCLSEDRWWCIFSIISGSSPILLMENSQCLVGQGMILVLKVKLNTNKRTSLETGHKTGVYCLVHKINCQTNINLCKLCVNPIVNDKFLESHQLFKQIADRWFCLSLKCRMLQILSFFILFAVNFGSLFIQISVGSSWLNEWCGTSWIQLAVNLKSCWEKQEKEIKCKSIKYILGAATAKMESSSTSSINGIISEVCALQTIT